MKALTWHGTEDVRIDNVSDPSIQEPTDAIVRITSSGLCGSDLHLYEVMGPFMSPGDILGHEPMGVVEAVGPGVTHIGPGDRVVIPFNISCGSCGMCDAVCSRNVRRRRCASTTREPRCSATRSCTGRSPVGRPSSCGCRRPTTDRSR